MKKKKEQLLIQSNFLFIPEKVEHNAHTLKHSKAIIMQSNDLFIRRDNIIKT